MGDGVGDVALLFFKDVSRLIKIIKLIQSLEYNKINAKYFEFVLPLLSRSEIGKIFVFVAAQGKLLLVYSRRIHFQKAGTAVNRTTLRGIKGNGCV